MSVDSFGGPPPTYAVAARPLDRLLAPRSIAFIGGRDAAAAVRICRRFGFEGAIWPVSPTRPAMDGVAAYPTLAALPGPPDAAFVGVNRTAAVDVVAELAAIGAGGAVVYASGFAESAAELADGPALQERLVAAAGAMPFLGPNCYGLLNAGVGAALWPSEHGVARAKRGVALISQSSNIAISLTMQRRGLPVAAVATLGNQAQTGVSALGRAMLARPEVTALGLLLEGIDDAAAMEDLAATARTLGKPIVVLKTGATEGAQAAALSHTAALAGSDTAAGTFFRRLGIPRVSTLTALIETLKLLHVHGPLPGGRLSALCCSGGETALLSDAAAGRTVRFPAFPPARRDAISATLSPMVRIGNPLDYHTFIWADAARMTETYACVFDEGLDLSLLCLDWPRSDRCSDIDWLPAVEALEAATARSGARTALLATVPENLPEPVAERLIAAGIAPLAGVEDALTAAEAAAAIGAAWNAPASPALLTLGGDGGAPPPRHIWDEAASKAALARAGVPTPEGRVVPLNAVAAAAEALSGPVAVKALGVAHKTEAAAVALRCDPSGAHVEATRMAAAGATRFLVERMAPPGGIELIIGARAERPYGLALTVGAGGVLAELLGDVETLLLPVTDAALRSALGQLRVARLLAGWRGAPAADLDATVAAIGAIARFAEAEAARLIELDVNPLIVGPWGALAVDALLVGTERAPGQGR